MVPPVNGKDRRRFFVVTPGRTGSSLLATILADAGADFGVPARDHWDTARGGWMEHPDIRRSVRHFRQGFELSTTKPRSPLRRALWTHYRTAGKRCLRRALERAVYVKAMHLDLAIPFAIKLGYFPQIIINHRPLAEQALSLSQMAVSWSVEEMAATYNRTYRNALLLVHAYGGCVVSYADLTDWSRTDWAAALGQITGLSADRLLQSRARRTKAGRAPAVEIPALDQVAEQTDAALDALSGLALTPSPQAVRNWERRMSDERAPAKRPAPVPAAEHATGVAIARRGSARWPWLERLTIEAESVWRSIKDRRVPWYLRAIAPLCAVAYTVAPIDPIPDRLPVIGHLDDLLVGAVLVALFIWMMPSSIRLQHRADAAARRGRQLAFERQT